VFFLPRVLKRVFLHYELDDVRSDALAIFIVPAPAVCWRGRGGEGGMHADVEDKGVWVSEGKSRLWPAPDRIQKRDSNGSADEKWEKVMSVEVP
jgi:hypothetical protein